MSNRLDPDQARLFLGPDLGPNYFQKLSADALVGKELNSHTDISSEVRCLNFGLIYISTLCLQASQQCSLCVQAVISTKSSCAGS